MAIEAFAPAKLNLALHVTGRRADGYHLLDSLVVFADVGDRLSAEIGDGLTLRVTGPFAEGVPTDDRNLVLKAAERLRQLRGVRAGAEMHLDKHLPHGAGIGGGSSDAAAAIGLLAGLWQVDPLDADEAIALGADVPVCLRAPQPTFMRGIGDILQPAPSIPEAWLVLVNPGIVVPTGRVFGRFDALYPEASPPLEPPFDPFDVPETFARWLRRQRNDLTKVAGELAPEIPEIVNLLRADKTCAACDMSGSGSTCWGLFFDAGEAEAAAARISASHSGWWVRTARILR